MKALPIRPDQLTVGLLPGGFVGLEVSAIDYWLAVQLTPAEARQLSEALGRRAEQAAAGAA